MKRSMMGVGLMAMALLLAGCTEKSATGEKKMSELKDETVFLRVNGETFKKHDFVVASTLYDYMARMASKDSLKGPNAKAERAVLLRRPFIVGELKRRALLAQFARANKIEANEANTKKAEDLFLKAMDRKRSTVDKVAAEFGGEEGELLKAWLKGDAVELTMREHFDTEHRMNITDADVMEVSNRWVQSQSTAAASNKLERALLEKALAEIKAGTDFVEVAKKYSIVPQEATEWAELDQDDVAEDHVALTEWLKTAKKPGMVSGILELEDGFGICKVTAYEREEADNDPDDKEQDPPEENWTVVRICRKLWEGYEPMTRAEIVDELYKARSREVQKKIGDAIMAKAVIEWPCGTNLFEHVETKREMYAREAAEKAAAKKAEAKNKAAEKKAAEKQSGAKAAPAKSTSK